MTTPRPAALPAYVHPHLVLDDDHVVEFVTFGAHDPEPCGATVWHRCASHGADSATPGWYCGGIYWRDVPGTLPPGPRWQLVSLDPLHVEPSLLFGCGHHGFIRNGAWQPA